MRSLPVKGNNIGSRSIGKLKYWKLDRTKEFFRLRVRRKNSFARSRERLLHRLTARCGTNVDENHPKWPQGECLRRTKLMKLDGHCHNTAIPVRLVSWDGERCVTPARAAAKETTVHFSSAEIGKKV